MSIPVQEQETTISFTRTEDTVRIWTNDTTVMTKLDKLADDPDSPWTCTKTGHLRNDPDSVADKEYEGPKSLLGFRRAHREMTEEQKEAARERFLAAWERRKAAEHA